MVVSMKSALLVVLGTLLISCSPNHIDFSSRQAPMKESDLGWIVENLQPELASQLAQNPSLKVQALHEKRGLFEVRGLKYQDILDLQQAHRDLKFQKNQFVYFNQNSDLPQEEKCSSGFTNGENLKAPATLLLGQNLQVEQNLKIEWTVVSPLGSKISKSFKASTKLNFTPDMVGWYQIITLKSQANGVCQRSVASVLVTSNPIYEIPPNNLPEFSQRLSWGFDSSLPWYLEELEAKKLWSENFTGKNIVVAVLDSGINYQHRLLKDKIAINTKEIPGNLIDDDHNGYVDDVIGYDFVFGDAFPFDEEGHGSHISGLIAADSIGLAPDAKILPLKAVSNLRSDYGSLAAAIYYAIDAKVRILNISAGQTNQALPEIVINALKEAERQGILVVVAAGNGSDFGLGLNIDQTPVYPASLGLKNILVVSAYDRENALAPYANFGANSVAIVAPGGMDFTDPMLSCYIENPSHIELFNETGTSMATALVSASSALLLQKHPDLAAQQIMERFLKSGEDSLDLKSVSISGKKFRPAQGLGLLSKGL